MISVNSITLTPLSGPGIGETSSLTQSERVFHYLALAQSQVDHLHPMQVRLLLLKTTILECWIRNESPGNVRNYRGDAFRTAS